MLSWGCACIAGQAVELWHGERTTLGEACGRWWCSQEFKQQGTAGNGQKHFRDSGQSVQWTKAFQIEREALQEEGAVP
ncbi:hypothetical protein COCOBI_12-0310 [Coccomyxa sp. Obi]|nr:hypothetical protein COCOBI_12-0310 [Coccomyxa sp. Obi]